MNTLFVDTAWLAEHLDDENLRVVDVRGHVLPASQPPPHYFAHHDEYQESHIPGAVFVDWTSDITNPDSPNGTQIAAPEAYAALMNKLGIGPETVVVAYDDAAGMFAARFWWTLNYYGHKQVAVLDGGWQRWVEEGRPVTADIPDVSTGMFSPDPDSAVRYTKERVQAALSDEATFLIDVRSPGEFAGEASRAKRAGHIPGAVNVPRKSLLDEDGRLLPLEALKTRFGEVGVPSDGRQIVVYCNSGVSASYGMMALKVAGYENVAVYDGSWKEWGNDDAMPIG